MSGVEVNKTGRKKNRITALILVIVIALGLVIFRNGIAMNCYRLYWGSRLTCETELYIDGKAYPISAENVTGKPFADGEENRVNSVETTDTGAAIRCQGSEYGAQPFLIEIQPDGMTEMLQIPVAVVVANNWEISKIKLRIDADTTTQLFSYSGDYKMFQDHQEFSDAVDFYYTDGIRISGI